MAITLNSTLKTAQDGTAHQPIQKVISSPATSEIPFIGNEFLYQSAYTLRPNLINMSDGRLVAVFVDDNVFKLQYTGTDKAEWVVVTPALTYGTSYYPTGISIVELASGNLGLLIRAYKSATEYKLMYAEVQYDGTIVTGATQIAAYTSWISEAHVIMLADTTFLIVYGKLASGVYSIQKRTASAWGTFSAESALSFTGLEPTYIKDNPHLLQMDDGDIFLCFDYKTEVVGTADIFNIFSSISTDNGATWSAPEARTNYDGYGDVSLHPMMGQKITGEVYMVYYDQSNVVPMRDDAGFGYTNYNDYSHAVSWIHYDSSTGKVLVVWCNGNGVTQLAGSVRAITVIDALTWVVDKSYYDGSLPALTIVAASSLGGQHTDIQGGGRFVIVKMGNSMLVLDYVANEVKYYVWTTAYYSSYGLSKNISIEPNTAYDLGAPIHGMFYDATNEYVWFVMKETLNFTTMYFGHIDLNEEPDYEGNYTFHFDNPGGIDGYQAAARNRDHRLRIEYIAEYDYIVVNANGDLDGDWNNWCMGVFYIFTWNEAQALVTYFTASTHANFPYSGLVNRAWTYYNGHIYGGMTYNSTIDHVNKRGLVDIDIDAQSVSLHRPTYATADTYNFYFIKPACTGHLWISLGSSLARYTINDQSWIQYTESNFSGLTGGVSSPFIYAIDYDCDTGLIFIGVSRGDVSKNYACLLMFSEDGPVCQLKYDTYDPSTVEWAGSSLLATGIRETDPVIAIDSDDSLWALWTRYKIDDGILKLVWASERGDIDLTDDIMGAITITREMSKATTASFTLARGYLYDPQNSLSLLNAAVRKARKITISFGEKISGTSYFVTQATVFVKEYSLTYTRGEYPDINISCADILDILGQMTQVTSEYFNNKTPKRITESLLANLADFTDSDYSIAAFVSSHTSDHQFVDMNILAMIMVVFDHFFYSPYVDESGIFTNKQISLTKAIDHTYPVDTTKIIDYSPDTTFSVDTNRVRVEGESDDWLDVTYALEQITTLSGTVGWWEKKVTHKVWYSEDHEKVCMEPELVITQSIKLQGLLLDAIATGEGGESITYEDVDNKYCIVTINIPDLTFALIDSIGATVGLSIAAIYCDEEFNCGVYLNLLTIAMSFTMSILAAVANYQYEIWAKPIGQVRQTIQNEADDTTYQQECGQIVPEVIQDPLANTVSECIRVSEGQIEILKAERNRMKFGKVAHLQDQILDKIKIYHPYSKEPMEVVATKVTRTWGKGIECLDTVEGWRTDNL